MIPDQHQLKLDPKAEEHIFVRVAKYAKAWKYDNKVSRHVQTSRNITFDQNDTKIFLIPNEDDDNPVLNGENPLCEAAPEPLKDPDPIPPQTSSESTPNPSTPAPKPPENC